jgi:hypothetical protein
MPKRFWGECARIYWDNRAILFVWGLVSFACGLVAGLLGGLVWGLIWILFGGLFGGLVWGLLGGPALGLVWILAGGPAGLLGALLGALLATHPTAGLILFVAVVVFITIISQRRRTASPGPNGA